MSTTKVILIAALVVLGMNALGMQNLLGGVLPKPAA